MDLPRIFCWTRFGTEAGETASSIFQRKERERAANGGTFLWGIGNALGPSMEVLLELQKSPQALFSPIQSRPRPQDVTPGQVIRWHAGRALDGKLVSLPKASLVTSGHTPGRPLRRRYALVCKALEPIIQPDGFDEISIGQLFNYASGNRVGASQVTAIVGLDTSRPKAGLSYRIALRVTLAAPYYLELAEPELVEGTQKAFKAA